MEPSGRLLRDGGASILRMLPGATPVWPCAPMATVCLHAVLTRFGAFQKEMFQLESRSPYSEVRPPPPPSHLQPSLHLSFTTDNYSSIPLSVNHIASSARYSVGSQKLSRRLKPRATSRASKRLDELYWPNFLPRAARVPFYRKTMKIYEILLKDYSTRCTCSQK